MNRFDDDLSARLGALRDDDRARAPAFEQLTQRRERDPRQVRLMQARGFWVAAAAIAACVAVAFGLAARRRQVPRSVVAPSITAWQSPTQALLSTNHQSMFALQPTLSSVLDGATASTMWPKGG